MNLRTKRMICLLVAIASTLTIVGSLSYAYFTAIGEVTPMDAILNTASVSVKFSDNDLGVNAVLNFGEFVTKKFTIENTGTADAKIKIFFDEITNTYLEGSLTYTLSYSETIDGSYTEVISKTNVPKSQYSSKKILANSLTIPVGKKYYYELMISLNYLSDVNQDSDISAIFNTKFKAEDINYEINPGLETLKHLNNTSQGEKTNFDVAATTDEGVFEMDDDYGKSYYYRGAVTNNYVKFAGFYWRIIRINGDGSLRIIYDGTQAYANGSDSSNRFIKTGQAYNSNNNDNKYIGWMYGPAGTVSSTSKEEAQTNTVDSMIKKVVDEWYKTNIEDTGYGSAVSDTLFCNDRSIPGKDLTGIDYDTGLGYGLHGTVFGAHVRLGSLNGYTGAAPSFKCPQKNDAFTVNDTDTGNGSLTYPVGLITADEIVAAGSGAYNGNANSNYYLARSSNWYWSITPNGTNGRETGLFIVYYGSLGGWGVLGNGGVAPVINLTYEYASNLVGDGTSNNPYRLD